MPPVSESHGDPSRALTRDDLQTIASDHFRYGLLDGALLASPAPGTAHTVERRSPLLAVEVVSPSGAHSDRGSKRLAYEDFGVPSYWVVDPESRSSQVLELQDGAYVERALLAGADELTVGAPFPVALTCALFDR